MSNKRIPEYEKVIDLLLEGLSPKEIGRRLGVNPQNVQNIKNVCIGSVRFLKRWTDPRQLKLPF